MKDCFNIAREYLVFRALGFPLLFGDVHGFGNGSCSVMVALKITPRIEANDWSYNT